MQIHFDAEHRIFHLQTSEMSYAFGIAKDGRLRHLYWGASLQYTESLLSEAALQAFTPSRGVDDEETGYAELPTHELGDYGDPVLWLRHADGTRGLRLVYEKYEIQDNHLLVTLKDISYPVTVILHYQGWGDLPLISKWLVIKNEEKELLLLAQIKSTAWHLPQGWGYRPTHLSGKWAVNIRKTSLC